MNETKAVPNRDLPLKTVAATSPLRLSLGGGGTDLPFYADEHGCDLFAATLDMRVSVILGADPLSSGARVDVPDPIAAHGYIAAARSLVHPGSQRSVFVSSHVPPGSGLGGSAAFALSLIAAFDASIGLSRAPIDLAESAWRIERNCGVYLGRQDPYVIAAGGFVRLTSGPSCAASIESVSVPRLVMNDLESHLRLYFTGITRGSTASTAPPAAGPQRADKVAYLHEIKAIGNDMRKALTDGRLDAVPALIRAHSALKKASSKETRWTEIEDLARRHGAEATKLVGAGGGGFILVFASPDIQPSLDASMIRSGLVPTPVRFTEFGTRCLIVDNIGDGPGDHLAPTPLHERTRRHTERDRHG